MKKISKFRYMCYKVVFNIKTKFFKKKKDKNRPRKYIY